MNHPSGCDADEVLTYNKEHEESLPKSGVLVFVAFDVLFFS